MTFSDFEFSRASAGRAQQPAVKSEPAKRSNPNHGGGGPSSRRRFISAFTAAMLTTWVRGAGGRGATDFTPGRKKILFDTDIGSDIDDALALSYLLARPDCELVGITTVTGEAAKRAEIASALCHAGGQPHIPIYPGAESSLGGGQRQPFAPQYSALRDRARDSSFPAGSATRFMREKIRAHPGEITLLGVGPLTNIALLFRADPELPRLLKELVLMCGRFGASPTDPGQTEWNAMLDPEAAAIVFGGAVPPLRSYGLDVTRQLAISRPEATHRFGEDPRLRVVLELAQVWFEHQDQIYFNDPLAAVSVFSSDICDLERGNVSIDLTTGPDQGRTLWQPDPAGRHLVAAAVNPPRFFTTYFGAFGLPA